MPVMTPHTVDAREQRRREFRERQRRALDRACNTAKEPSHGSSVNGSSVNGSSVLRSRPDGMCWICWGDPAEVQAMPCGHVGLCDMCGRAAACSADLLPCQECGVSVCVYTLPSGTRMYPGARVALVSSRKHPM